MRNISPKIFTTTQKGKLPPVSAFVLLVAIVFVVGYALIPKDKNVSPPSLSPDERTALFSLPASEAPAEEKEQHRELVKSLAQEAEYLDINNCTPDPVVLRVSYNGSFTIRNNDEQGHMIGHAFWKFLVPAGGTKNVVVAEAMGYGPDRVYKYSCDGNEIKGFLTVTE